MRQVTRLAAPAVVIAWVLAAVQSQSSLAQMQQPAAPSPDWAMNATIIEACSCPMFCQCYFDTKPAAPAASHDAHASHASAEHFCKFNNAYQVNTGNFGDTKLDGAKFWLYGDLGDDFSKGQMNWAVLTFDPSVTAAQRQGIQTILRHVFGVTWKSFTVAEDKPIEWTAGADRSVAKLDGGKAAEVVLKKNQGMTDDPIIIKNLKYWGVPRNDGFILMQNEIQALRQPPPGQQPYEFKRTNGFMITFDINSADLAKQQH